MLIKAAVTHSAGADYVIEEVELAEPKYNEVLVKVVATGVCHTDAFIRDQLMPFPKLVQFYKEGRFPIDKISMLYDFKDINKAFEDSNKGLIIKPVVVMPE